MRTAKDAKYAKKMRMQMMQIGNSKVVMPANSEPPANSLLAKQAQTRIPPRDPNYFKNPLRVSHFSHIPVQTPNIGSPFASPNP